MAGVKLNLEFNDRQLSTAELWGKEQAADGSNWESLKESARRIRPKTKTRFCERMIF
ncbi:hypothetical protein J8M21_19065 [Pseudoalteromonas luteoviolacea]|uniref:hypothetical protein n=1 Tax=Pseudoalteromonas luteoviolacea TaxID=43657 RepID=UPI001B3A58DB|nr:hypothetical protein [Pseudoalteromonas luteoviolacea]MBQ4879317.1 hypothetical protein [Pseudoalteromonas luteoviolacea]MBQ4908377.1 hypothetical protein [Pseudoalteromonas luteoviolacea]